MESERYMQPPLSSTGSRSAINRGSEASIASLGSSSGSRSGIKMGLTSQRLAINRPTTVRPLDPTELIMGQSYFDSAISHERRDENLAASLLRLKVEEQTSDQDEYESEESEWESEITPDGNVQYVVPFAADEIEDRFRKEAAVAADQPKQATQSDGKESGKRLSRLVRRRESKRDRNGASTAGQVVLKTPGGNQAITSRWKNSSSHNHESSDNDSSTYGQIKTFEAFFEATNLDCSVTSPPPPQQATRPSEAQVGDKDDVTEIHEVVLKFQAKPFKSQIPRFQMLLHGDNPANRGMLLENLLGIVPVLKPIQSVAGMPGGGTVIDNSVVIANLVPQGPSSKVGEKIRVGDIIRSLDGHHITLDSVNTFLLTKLTRIQNSSSTVKVKLILQRPMAGASKSILPPLSEIDMSSQRKAVWEQHRTLNAQALGILESAQVCAAIVTQNNPANSESVSMDLSNVIYQFPRPNAGSGLEAAGGFSSSLLKVSGIFFTLIQLLPDIVASEPQTMSLLVPTNASHDPTWMHVALQIDGDEIFLLAVSGARLSSERTHHLAQQLTRFLLLKHSSLMAAALSSSQELDQVVGNLLYETLFDRMTAIKLESITNEVPSLLLPPDVHFQVEDALNQFESGDFQVLMSQEVFHTLNVTDIFFTLRIFLITSTTFQENSQFMDVQCFTEVS